MQYGCLFFIDQMGLERMNLFSMPQLNTNPRITEFKNKYANLVFIGQMGLQNMNLFSLSFLPLSFSLIGERMGKKLVF